MNRNGKKLIDKIALSEKFEKKNSPNSLKSYFSTEVNL
jgi:hypothetical protein